MRVLLVVNGSASSVTARARVVVQKAIAAEHELTVAATSRRGHATRLARGAAADGLDVVAVLGGDGTLNEASNGLAGLDPPSTTALAALPGGSTNVFARTIGMANDPIEATHQLLAALRAGSVVSVGLGEVNGRFFLFHVGVGFDAAVVAEVERNGSLKRYLGAAVFAAAAIRTWRRGFDRRTPWFALTYPDGRDAVPAAFFAVVSNTDPYTYVGTRPLRLAPGTGLDTPLAVTSFTDLRLGTLARAGLAAAGFQVPAPRSVVARAGVRDVEVLARRPVPYQVDGDHVGDARMLRFRYVPGALRVVLPMTDGGADVASDTPVDSLRAG